MTVHEASLSSDLQGSILKPAEQTGWGVVVLAGSSGRVDVARAKLLAGLGAVCIALRWFGGERQPPGICEVPLEVFTRATDRLIAEGCERVAYVGTSKGAEAALLIATDDPRVRVVAAISPSSVVWANIGPGIVCSSRAKQLLGLLSMHTVAVTKPMRSSVARLGTRYQLFFSSDPGDQRMRRVPRITGIPGSITKRICGRSVSETAMLSDTGWRSAMPGAFHAALSNCVTLGRPRAARFSV